VKRDGTTNAGANLIRAVDTMPAGETVNGVLALNNKGVSVTVTSLTAVHSGNTLPDTAQAGVLENTSGPVSQVTLGLDDKVSGTIEVYGKNIG
jgi:hypothetical protein